MAYDVTIVGAGLAGAIMAERLAVAGNRVLVLERRSHVGGNCFDELDEKGVLVHRYGPHVFRTASQKVVDYLSQFTAWRPYEHRVLSRTRKGLMPIPINATTLEKWFAVEFAHEAEVEAFLQRCKIPSAERNSEEVCLARVGRELYEAFFAGYTQKQWGVPAVRLAPGVCGRIPVRTNRDDRYFTEPFQAMPRDGYTAMFERLFDNDRIDVACDVGAMPRPDQQVIWTGCLDEAFGFKHGRLPWRSLRFELVHVKSTELVQEAAVINEPSLEVPHTRTSEYRWLTGQKAGWSSLHREFPVMPGPDAEPYYPVPSKENDELLALYRAEMKDRLSWTFCGRLARYQYLEMGQVVGQALATARGLLAVLA